MKGWVYVISNPAMPGLVKVGYSLKDPQIRANEFGGAGTPHKFQVEYQCLVNSPAELEKKAHTALTKFHESK
jgi:hypothetical protein